jgi:hypothetical protein
MTCLKTIGNAADLDPGTCDPQNVTACLGNEPCHAFLVKFGECAQAARANATGSTVGSIEACLYAAVREDATLLEGATPFMATVLPCAWSACAGYCVVDTASACVSCQGTKCTSELSAYAANPDAFLYRWCRTYCGEHSDDATCLDECTSHKAAAQDTLTVYGACVTSSCGDVCQ